MVAELCCGDCRAQEKEYRERLGVERYVGVDVDAQVIRMLKKSGVECLEGDALDAKIVEKLLGFDLIFFGPPLSKDCLGHQFFTFEQVRPSYAEFLTLAYGRLGYTGTIACIGPKTTTLGDARRLYDGINANAGPVSLRAVHYATSSVTGRGESTEPRLKYVELWFSRALADEWERIEFPERACPP